MATSQEHYLEAERLLGLANNRDGVPQVDTDNNVRDYLLAAQAHATLALRADEIEARVAADEEHRDLLAVRTMVEAAVLVCKHNGGEDIYLRSSLGVLRRASTALMERFEERLRAVGT